MLEKLSEKEETAGPESAAVQGEGEVPVAGEREVESSAPDARKGGPKKASNRSQKQKKKGKKGKKGKGA